MIADRPEVAAWSGTDLAWAVIALLSATIALLVARLATASRPRRRTLLPVYVPALVLTVPLLAFHGFAAGVLHLDADTLSTAGWFVTGSRVAMPFGFLLAIVQASFFAGSALKRLIGQIGDDPSASRLREIVADALDDPSVELVFRVDGDDGFVDSRGEPVAAAVARDGRASSPVARQGETVAVDLARPRAEHRPGARARREPGDAARAREGSPRRASLPRHGRARVAAADAERRRVERDLHDGAQQHLVALRIQVELARDAGEGGPGDRPRGWPISRRGSRACSRELRDLAHGVHPPVLRDYGLRAALASAARRCTPPAALVADEIGRYPGRGRDRRLLLLPRRAAERRQARRRGRTRRGAPVRASRTSCASRSSTTASAATSSRLDVPGAGFTNMSERVAAVGGTLTVDSAAGHGTQLRGRIPLGRP